MISFDHLLRPLFGVEPDVAEKLRISCYSLSAL